MKLQWLAFFFFCFIQLEAQDFTRSPSQGLGMSGQVVADFNGDGYEDVIGRSSAGIVLVLNDQTNPVAFTQKDLGLTFDAKGTPAVADFDGDDDLDVVFAKGNDFALFLLENDGLANFTVTDLTVGGTSMLQAKDLDGDGDVDIVGVDAASKLLSVYVNDGTQHFSKKEVATTTNSIENFDVADLDKDGDQDIVLGLGTFSGEEVLLFDNDGANNFAKNILAEGSDFKRMEDLLVADINGDNQMDIIAISNNSCAAWLNLGSSMFEQKKLFDYDFSNGVGIFRSLAVADFNGDGKLDVVVGDNSLDTYWYKQISSSPPAFERANVGSVAPVFSIETGDFDKDGDVDIVVSNGNFWWYENEIEQMSTSTLDFSETALTIFPNPFQDYLQLNIIQPLRYRLSMTTLEGKSVFAKMLDTDRVQLPQLPSGVYLLTLTDRVTKEARTARVVKW